MKIQHFAVIFIIIILPISFLLSEYMESQIEEINLQNKYNQRIEEACFDAVKAFEINTNSKNKNNFKEREEEVIYSVESFYKSLSDKFSLNGYDSKSLKDYTPAIVVNLYDGFYLYSRYKDANSSEFLYGLRPYEKYSCRYVLGDKYDFNVNYTLDNYIEIIGLINGEIVKKSGYLIDITKIDENSKNKIDSNEQITELYYDGLKIEKENLANHEIVYENSKLVEKIQNIESTSAVNYYIESYKFTKWVQDNLSEITRELCNRWKDR